MALFNKLLIANRGEIACRIIGTAHKMGIKTIAIFSETDTKALHVKMSDEAYLIGKAASKESYLNIEKIIHIAKKTNAEAIHPGYGFLSENHLFAEACEQANIIFIGPSATAIKLMANKNIAKEIMSSHGVPVLPGYYDETSSESSLLSIVKKIGYPIVLKAVAGGGGKGLRLVHLENQFEQAYHAVKREAKAFFNDDRLMVEKYLENARHIEVQVLGDHYGTVQPIFTRDCSIQRRHQKIIEEAPAPNLSTELQEKIIEAGITAAKAIQYTNAGTIEFLVEKENFYFLETNTRLQVEHPITEMITGIDIVEWQVRIAAGEKLFSENKTYKGHSIEVRLNAEDPERDFLPSAGKLQFFRFPENLEYVRIDSGYREDDEVNIYYDSLLAKVIAWGKNRLQAIERLNNVIDKIFIFGIKTNLTLLKNILNNCNFRKSQFNTNFLQIENVSTLAPISSEAFFIAALFLTHYSNVKSTLLTDVNSPWLLRDNWKLFGPQPFTIKFSHNKIVYPITIVKHEGTGFIMTNEEATAHCSLSSLIKLKNDVYHLELILNNSYLQATLYQHQSKLELIMGGQYYQFEIDDEYSTHELHTHEGQLLAPMPGTLVSLLVNSGQKVNKGDRLLIIEAMKMEHTLYAPRAGVIKQCYYQVGDLVKEGAELIEFDESE